MTDELLVQSNATPVENIPPAPVEHMVPQSEVDKFAGALKHSYYEKGKADALAELQSKQAQNNQGAQQVAQGSLSEEQVRNMILEQTQKIQGEQARMAMAERVVGEFAGKMELGKDAYEDFEDTVKQIDLASIPEIVQLANGVSNTHDVMYDIAKNPYKIAQLKMLAQTSPHLARAEMNRLSQSIIANNNAKAQVSDVKAPLSQLKSSTNTVGSGTHTLSDFKRMFKR